jgi:hypothetical protein
VIQLDPLTDARQWRTISFPMARLLTAERTLQGQALSSGGAFACFPGKDLAYKAMPERRDFANTGRPVVVRW